MSREIHLMTQCIATNFYYKGRIIFFNMADTLVKPRYLITDIGEGVVCGK